MSKTFGVWYCAIVRKFGGKHAYRKADRTCRRCGAVQPRRPRKPKQLRIAEAA
jgi:hypothetical protein